MTTLYVAIAALVLTWVSLWLWSQTLTVDTARAVIVRRWIHSAGVAILVGLGVVSGFEMGKRGVTSAPAAARSSQQPFSSRADESAIRTAVRQAQEYEHFVLYREPSKVTDTFLLKHWVPVEQGGVEIDDVRESVERLQDRGWYYGEDSRLDVFQIRFVNICSADYALAATVEKWHLPLYETKTKSRVKERTGRETFGPYDVLYILRKLNGTWLIQDSSTPRPR